jgi:hypothetical protein
VLRLLVPVAALAPVLGVVLGVRALHGATPAARMATHASVALAICALPLLLHALALRETRMRGAAADAPDAAPNDDAILSAPRV